MIAAGFVLFGPSQASFTALNPQGGICGGGGVGFETTDGRSKRVKDAGNHIPSGLN